MNVGELLAWEAITATVAILGGLAFAFGLRYWSRDAVILRARRRDARRLRRSRRAQQHLLDLERQR